MDDLFSGKSKEEIAIERLRAFEPKDRRKTRLLKGWILYSANSRTMSKL